ncbi:MAG: hypothetical protein OXG41_04735 [Acidimicrobiaceae bacterium]|nr:hypothetical protein [Acidimicrobiaceae bacterium]
MTTRYVCSVDAAATVCATNAGSATTNVAAPTAVSTPAVGARGRGVVVGSASGAFDVSGRLRREPPGPSVASRSPISVDVDCGWS